MPNFLLVEPRILPFFLCIIGLSKREYVRKCQQDRSWNQRTHWWEDHFDETLIPGNIETSFSSPLKKSLVSVVQQHHHQEEENHCSWMKRVSFQQMNTWRRHVQSPAVDLRLLRTVMTRGSLHHPWTCSCVRRLLQRHLNQVCSVFSFVAEMRIADATTFLLHSSITNRDFQGWNWRVFFVVLVDLLKRTGSHWWIANL
jgi:hypothetical protein